MLLQNWQSTNCGKRNPERSENAKDITYGADIYKRYLMETKRNKKGLKAVLIGAAGHVAPRHLKAMKSLNIDLVVAYDPHDSVGILDSYFPECGFEVTRDTFINLDHSNVDLVSVCSPNIFHIYWIDWAFSIGADVICEKPVVLSLEDYEHARSVAKKSDHSLYTILQLRELPLVTQIKEFTKNKRPRKVSIVYVTPRGEWYDRSWKGDTNLSGGLIYNIGVHMFDLIAYLFGDRVESIQVDIARDTVSDGTIIIGNTAIKWHLSTNRYIPACRTIAFDDGNPMDLGYGFTELHTSVYQAIITGWGDKYNCVTNDSIYQGMKLMDLVSKKDQEKREISPKHG